MTDMECTYCRKTIEDAQDVFIKKIKNGKAWRARHYHAKCWTRKMNAGKRLTNRMKNPVGGFR